MKFVLTVECEAPSHEVYNLESLIELPSTTSTQLQSRLEEVINDYLPITAVLIKMEVNP